jgi:hypothetical protein
MHFTLPCTAQRTGFLRNMSLRLYSMASDSGLCFDVTLDHDDRSTYKLRIRPQSCNRDPRHFRTRVYRVTLHTFVLQQMLPPGRCEQVLSEGSIARAVGQAPTDRTAPVRPRSPCRTRSHLHGSTTADTCMTLAAIAAPAGAAAGPTAQPGRLPATNQTISQQQHASCGTDPRQ